MTQPHDVITRADQISYSGVVFTEFKGKLEDMEFPVENGQPKTKLQFVEMDVIHTKAPYPHPAAEISMNRANKQGKVSDRGPWGMLLISSRDQGYEDITELVKKTLHMRASEKKIDADESRGTSEGSFTVWEILSVDGKDSRNNSSDSLPNTGVPAADESPK